MHLLQEAGQFFFLSSFFFFHETKRNVAQLAEKTKEALALEDKLAGVEASHEAKRQGLVQELESVKSKRAEEAAAAEAEISKLKSEVGSLNEFRRKRAEHDAALEELRVKSEAEIKMLKDILATSEQRTAAMREEMEKQKEDELRKIRQAMFSSAYEKLDGVTKATVAENDRLAGQLAKQSKQAEALLRENKRLKDECAELKRKVDMLESLEREQAKRSQSAKRSVKALEEKLSQRDEEIQKLQATRPASPVAVLAPAAPVTEARESAGPMKSRIRELEAELEHLRRSNERYRGELSRAEFAIEDAARVREEYHALLEKHDESTWFLLSALDDAKSHVLDAAGDASEEKPKLDEFSREDREKVISFFLGKLHTYKLAASEGILRAAVPALPREFG